MKTSLTAAAVAVAVALALLLRPAPVLACGGLFCSGNTPVVQTGEKIIFGVDREEGVVHAIINVVYQGPPNEFAWVLPLQSAPTQVKVAPASMFNTIDALTAPQFKVTVDQKGVCADEVNVFPGGASDSLVRLDDASNEGVRVISEQQVGPYETAVLQSNNPGELRDWLVENGYFVTETMMSLVKPYLDKGDVLLALKLRKDKDTGDIQPIWVSMSGLEVCVPIRLTAIAALADMDITAVVLSNEGRAIPKNYFHVPLNLARIDWIRGGFNYRSLIKEAADEGSGNAFTTEFAGSARIFDNQIYRGGSYDRGALENTHTLSELVEELRRQQLINKPEMADIFQQFFGNVPLPVPATPLDPHEVVEVIWSRIVTPELDVQRLLDRYTYATRLYTLISPEEMNVDPEFSFRNDLPDVGNVHNAKLLFDCGLGGDPSSAHVTITIEETRQVIELDSSRADRSLLDRMPAAASVEQLEERRTVLDNTSEIAELLERHNALSSQSCGCEFEHGSGRSFGAVGLLLAILLLVRSARRKKAAS